MNTTREHPDTKPTAKKIVLIWLAEYAIRQGDMSHKADVLTYDEAPMWWKVEVTPWHIEYKIQGYAVSRFTKQHRGTTYVRRWRELRNEGRLSDIGVVDFKSTDREDGPASTKWVLTFERDAFFEAIRTNDSPLTYGPQSDPRYEPVRGEKEDAEA